MAAGLNATMRVTVVESDTGGLLQRHWHMITRLQGTAQLNIPVQSFRCKLEAQALPLWLGQEKATETGWSVNRLAAASLAAKPLEL